MRRLVLVTSIAGVLLAGSAAAQTRDENWGRCRGDNPDLRIGACTALIQSGRESTADVALAFHNRGIGYYDITEYDKAVSDFDQAIQRSSWTPATPSHGPRADGPTRPRATPTGRFRTSTRRCHSTPATSRRTPCSRTGRCSGSNAASTL